MALRSKLVSLPAAMCAALLAGALAWTAAPAADAAAFACADPSNLCVDAGGAKWEAGKSASAKDKKKRSEKAPGSVSLTIEGGRGSLFVNGRYAGTAPLSNIDVPSGRNDVQVRDGSTVLSQGVLTVPKGASVSLTVNHP
ncbi:MAG: hypothetical protein K1X88_00560 [Nannocystaceae bacterium]|nr:hypothetical protein [Nannocystaceae bacterium]